MVTVGAHVEVLTVTRKATLRGNPAAPPASSTPTVSPFSLCIPSSSNHRASSQRQGQPGEQAWGAGDHGLSGAGLPAHPRELAQGRPAPCFVPAHPSAQLWSQSQVGNSSWLPNLRIQAPGNSLDNWGLKTLLRGF